MPTAADIVGTTEVNGIELEAATMRIDYLKQENEELRLVTDSLCFILSLTPL